MEAPLLFLCPTCKRDVVIVHEHPTEGFVLGLKGTVWQREYSCGHGDRALEHSFYYRQIANAGRRRRAKR